MLASSSEDPHTRINASSSAGGRGTDREEIYHSLLGSIDIGFCVIEMIFDDQMSPIDYRFLEVNPAFERHTGFRNATGKCMRELVADHDDIWFQTYGAVTLTGKPARVESHAVAMGRWFEVYATRIGGAGQNRVGALFTDITARKEAEESARISRELLHDAQVRLEAALAAGNIATWTFDLVNNRVVADANLARLFSVSSEDAAGGQLGSYLQAILSEDRVRVTQEIESAIASGERFESEYRVILPDSSFRWLVARGKVERDSNGKAISLPGVVVDITQRKQAEELVRRAEDRLRLATKSAKIGTFDFVPEIGELNWDDQCKYLFGLPPDAKVDYSVFLAGLHPDDRERTDAVVQSVLDPRSTGYYSIDYRTVGLKDGGVVRWIMAEGQAYFDAERTRAERFVGTVLDITDRRLAEEEERQRAEREALVNRIRAAVRSSAESEEILKAALSALGEGLRADRCYFVRYNQARDSGFVSPEWLREGSGLESMVGVSRQMSAYSVNRAPEFRSGNTQVVNDTIAFDPEKAAPLLALNVRALVRVPIEIGNQMTALGVAMTTARHWTIEDVQLIENVAVWVRSALESAQVRQREHNIARQLQAALVPAIPEHIPGMSLCGFYRVALEEAEVGGDFIDVFSLKSSGCTCLVVADLSGKGLAAASQVAAVRNMLRYALHSEASLATSVTRLNQVLADHELLAGFATLFVGIYDAATRELAYVNCGQEPGLVWRAASGEIVRLEPTGPVLGGFFEGTYDEARFTLKSGDVLALFTDGLTEVGPTRKQFLNVEGVSDLFHQYCSVDCKPGDSPQAIADRLIAGVDNYAQGGVRDDIALLVGIVEPCADGVG